jgi:CRISPR-associated endonuclease Csn1
MEYEIRGVQGSGLSSGEMAEAYFGRLGKSFVAMEHMTKANFLDTLSFISKRENQIAIKNTDYLIVRQSERALAEFKKQIVERLKERRVVQHVPADMSGARLEMNTWRVVKTDGDQVTLRQRTFGPKDIDPETGARKRTTKETKERASKLVGLKEGKLSALKGALVIGENYGVALQPEPTMIAFHQVKKQLEALRMKNGGKPVAVLRNGMLIRVATGDFAGVWRVRSCKNKAAKGLVFNLTHADRCQSEVPRVAWCKDDVRVNTLLKSGMTIIDSDFCGVAS